MWAQDLDTLYRNICLDEKQVLCSLKTYFTLNRMVCPISVLLFKVGLSYLFLFIFIFCFVLFLMRVKGQVVFSL